MLSIAILLDTKKYANNVRLFVARVATSYWYIVSDTPVMHCSEVDCIHYSYNSRVATYTA